MQSPQEFKTFLNNRTGNETLQASRGIHNSTGHIYRPVEEKPNGNKINLETPSTALPQKESEDNKEKEKIQKLQQNNKEERRNDEKGKLRKENDKSRSRSRSKEKEKRL